MLKDDFYIIIDFKSEYNSVLATIELNKNHAVYEGHFPNQPVVPGVCEVQMIKEILSHHLQKKLRLAEASDIKFLRIINPLKDNIASVKINYSFLDNDDINVTAQIFQKNTCSLKLNAVLRFIETKYPEQCNL